MADAQLPKDAANIKLSSQHNETANKAKRLSPAPATSISLQ